MIISKNKKNLKLQKILGLVFILILIIEIISMKTADKDSSYFETTISDTKKLTLYQVVKVKSIEKAPQIFVGLVVKVLSEQKYSVLIIKADITTRNKDFELVKGLPQINKRQVYDVNY